MPAKATRKPVRKRTSKTLAKRPVTRRKSSIKKHPIHKRVYHAVRKRIKRNGFIRPKVVPILAATSVAAIGVYFLAFSKAATPTTYQSPKGVLAGCSATRPTLYMGANNDPSCFNLMRFLLNIGGRAYVIDDTYTAKTKAVVTVYQFEHGIEPADGVFGPSSWQAIERDPDPKVRNFSPLTQSQAQALAAAPPAATTAPTAAPTPVAATPSPSTTPASSTPAPTAAPTTPAPAPAPASTPAQPQTFDCFGNGTVIKNTQAECNAAVAYVAAVVRNQQTPCGTGQTRNSNGVCYTPSYVGGNLSFLDSNTATVQRQAAVVASCGGRYNGQTGYGAVVVCSNMSVSKFIVGDVRTGGGKACVKSVSGYFTAQITMYRAPASPLVQTYNVGHNEEKCLYAQAYKGTGTSIRVTNGSDADGYDLFTVYKN